MNQLIINDSKFKEWFKYINHKVYIKKKTFEDVGNKEISIKKIQINLVFVNLCEKARIQLKKIKIKT